MNATFLWLEFRRVLRNPRTLVLTVVMPAALFLLLSHVVGGGGTNGVSYAAYVMVNMAAYGAVGSALFSAANIAMERKLGWNRQLRVTSLRPVAYVASKGVVAWLVTLASLVLVYAVGFAAGVRLPALGWLAVFAGTAVAVVPLVVLGVGVGLLGRVDAVQPIMTVLFLVLALIGGLWFPVQAMPPLLATIAKLTPSYWLGAAARSGLGMHEFGARGVLVLAGWTLVFGAFAAVRYRAATGRS